MYIPNKLKFRKTRRGRVKFCERKVIHLKFGYFGLKALENGKISSRQIEAGRQAIRRKIRPNGKVWIRMFPHLSVSKKSVSVRMGKGKGNISHWFCPVKQGQILYEISGVSESVAKEALYVGSLKLPLSVKIVSF